MRGGVPRITAVLRTSLCLALVIGVRIKMSGTEISNHSSIPSLHGLIAADLNGDLNARDFPPLPTFQREQFVGVSRPISTVRLSIAWRSMKVIVVAWIAIWFTREGEIRVQGVASWRDTRLSFRDKAWEWNEREIYIYIKFESKKWNFWIVYFARKASFWREKNLFEERQEDIKLGK